ncbi:MAG: hypothetical protein KDE46_23745 [Caldilineaceae bacterium]|nr:hypothetical protein [Caldilineaceae bacterium]
MDDNRRGSNIFELYASKEAQKRFDTRDAAQEDIEQMTYMALEIEEDTDQRWLRLHEASGLMRLMPYSDLIGVICAPPHWVGLQYRNAIVTVEGRNLIPMVKLLQTQQLAAIYCFVDEYPEPPVDEETPVITRLTFQTYAEAETANGMGLPEGVG